MWLFVAASSFRTVTFHIFKSAQIGIIPVKGSGTPLDLNKLNGNIYWRLTDRKSFVFLFNKMSFETD